jgi:hypothetical protein
VRDDLPLGKSRSSNFRDISATPSIADLLEQREGP